MDAYYASIEQRDDPSLRGKPVIVGGPPNSRSVVSTASYEARKFGVKSAMPCAQAYRLCPQGIFVPPRFAVYKAVSNQIREIFYEYTDKVEPLSLDEAYLDVSETIPEGASATALAREIKQRIFETTGLTASAGVGPSKFIAKLASGMRKPDGLTVIRPEHVDAFMKELPVGQFHGVGKATEERLNGAGLFRGADIVEKGEDEMVRLFGKTGRWLFQISCGVDNRDVKSTWVRKSLGAEETFEADISDPEELLQYLKKIAREVARRLEKAAIAGKTISLKVRYNTFERISRSRTLDHFVQDEETLFQTAASLLSATEAGNRPVRLLGISLSGLNTEADQNNGQQLELDFLV